MLDEPPGFVEQAGGFIQSEHDALEGHFPTILSDDGIEAQFRLGQSFTDIRLDVCGVEGGPANVEVLGEERVCHVC